MSKPFSNLGFAENKNLFEPVMNDTVLFYADYAPYKIFFTKNAIVFGRPEVLTDQENHGRKEKAEKGLNSEPLNWNYFKIQFQNTDSEPRIDPLEKLHHTRNFQNPLNHSETIKANSYKHLLYKSIYPNIDLFLELPEEGGLKYSFIVHAGGDYKMIEMKYIGIDVNLGVNQQLSLSNNIHDFTDHAPTSFAQGSEIESQFIVENNTVKFRVGDYDTSQELVIDPWLETELPAEFFAYMKAYEIGFDYAGNCMILGNVGKMIALYDDTGDLQWVWESLNAIFSCGDITTNPLTGDTFYPKALAGPTDRIDVTGVLWGTSDFDLDGPNPFEKWKAKFNEETEELVLGNGSTTGAATVTIINADFTGETFYEGVPAPFGEIRDVSAMTLDPDGTAIYLSIASEIYYEGDSPYDNRLYKLDYSDPNTILWETDSEFEFVEVSSVAYGPPLPFMSNGFNGMVCGTEFLYDYDGNEIRRYNKMTGEFLGSYFFPDEIPFAQAGLDVDECDNLYVGKSDSIVIFSPELELIGGYEIPGVNHDLVIGNSKVYCTGDGFVAEFDVVGGASINVSATSTFCAGCNGTATFSGLACGIVAIEPESILWSPSGSTDVTATDLCEGWHIATVTWLDDEGETITVIDSVMVNSEDIDILVTMSVVDESCLGSCNGEVIITPSSGEAPYTYDLDGAVNATGVFTELCAGTFDVIVTDVNGCDFIGIVIVESAGGLGLSILTFNNPTCYGFTDGSITVETAEDFDDVTYTWVPENPIEGATFNTIGAGTYVVIASDDSGCTDSLVIILNNPDSLWAEIVTENPLCYGDSTGFAVITEVHDAQGDLDNISYFWAPNYFGGEGVGVDSAYNMPAGNYTVTINDDNGCSNVMDFTITEPTELVFSEFGFEPAFCRLFGYQSGNGVVFAAATGGTPDYTYEWLNLETLVTTDNSTWGGLNPGAYQITVTDNNGCTLIETMQLDSVSPIAAFTVDSDQLNEDCEGTELVIANFINQSEYFANPNDPGTDTTFLWNLNHPNDPWIITHDYFEIMDTNYVGEAVYEVCLIAQNKNGCADTTCKNLIVHVQPDLIAPNIFTPGSNGLNDQFTFEFKAYGMETFHCTIVNRWGIIVAELNDINQGWDGTDRNGDNCVAGVYFYIYQAIATNGIAFDGQGNVQLIRE